MLTPVLNGNKRQTILGVWSQSNTINHLFIFVYNFLDQFVAS
jgi:hypothetical protein